MAESGEKEIMMAVDAVLLKCGSTVVAGFVLIPRRTVPGAGRGATASDKCD